MPGDPQSDEMSGELTERKHATVGRLREECRVQMTWKSTFRESQFLHVGRYLRISFLFQIVENCDCRLPLVERI